MLILLSAVLSLNVAVAEPGKSESEFHANLAIKTIEKIIWVRGDLADVWQMARK